MVHILTLLASLVLVFLISGLATFLALNLLVPMIVHLIGEHRFVEMRSLIPCSYIGMGGVIGIFLFYMLARKNGWVSACWAFLLVMLIMTVLATLQLRLNGIGKCKKEFGLREKRLVRLNDRQVLTPEWVQTD